MKLYRDLQPDETLQAGDERLSGHSRQWVLVEAVWIGQPVAADSRLRFRRPVDAVPREEHERLQDVLAEVRYLHGHAMHDRDTMREQLAALQSQPHLQPVTPEAMAELESREAIGVLFVDGYGVQVASHNRYRGWWWCGGIGKLDRPTRGWFIELSTIPEVQQ